MDVVYPLKRGTDCDELRYSLRALEEFLPHGRVWVVGYRPRWASGELGFIAKDRPKRNLYADSTANVAAACESSRVSEHFVLMNDDFFLLRPMVGVPVLHRGPVADVAADYEARGKTGGYLEGMRATAALLAGLGCPEPVSYELHVPMVIHGPTMRRLLEQFDGKIRGLHKRTLYGNLTHCGGTRSVDVKVCRPADQWDRAAAFVSTSDAAFRDGAVGEWLRERFQAPSRYERRASR